MFDQRTGVRLFSENRREPQSFNDAIRCLVLHADACWGRPLFLRALAFSPESGEQSANINDSLFLAITVVVFSQSMC